MHGATIKIFSYSFVHFNFSMFVEVSVLVGNAAFRTLRIEHMFLFVLATPFPLNLFHTSVTRA